MAPADFLQPSAIDGVAEFDRVRKIERFPISAAKSSPLHNSLRSSFSHHSPLAKKVLKGQFQSDRRELLEANVQAEHDANRWNALYGYLIKNPEEIVNHVADCWQYVEDLSNGPELDSDDMHAATLLVHELEFVTPHLYTIVDTYKLIG